jgi:hypothetical protein
MCPPGTKTSPLNAFNKIRNLTLLLQIKSESSTLELTPLLRKIIGQIPTLRKRDFPKSLWITKMNSWLTRCSTSLYKSIKIFPRIPATPYKIIWEQMMNKIQNMTLDKCSQIFIIKALCMQTISPNRSMII